MPDMTVALCTHGELHGAGALSCIEAGAAASTSSSCWGSMHAKSHTVVHHHVPHCQQHFSWDCGLACVLMVVKAVAGQGCPDYQTLREMCPTTSVWTVDLAHLLRRFSLDVAFFTTTLGPNPAYASEGFYMANMQEDEQRVSQLFLAAPDAGIALRQRSLSTPELQGLMLTGTCLVIALVDKRKLYPWMLCADLPALCGVGTGYTGHYVLLIGFDSGPQEYIVRDPATPDAEQRVSTSAFDQARMSFGTDEDLIVVPLPAQAGGLGGGGTQQHVRQTSEQARSTVDADSLPEHVRLKPCDTPCDAV